MKLWKVTEQEYRGYDMYAGFIIRAETAEDAREIANSKQLSGKWVVEEVVQDGEPGIILHDFNAG